MVTHQDPYMELAALDVMGVDGLFTDNTPTASRYLAVRHLLPGTSTSTSTCPL